MPKAAIQVGDFSDVDGAEGYADDYSGEVPPKGLYRTVVKVWQFVINGSGNPMFKILMIVDEPAESPKAKYNGYAMWHNANIGEKSAPFLNAMLDAYGLNRRAVYKGGVFLDNDEKTVLRIDKTKVLGLPALVTTKREEYPAGSGEWSLKPQTFSPAAKAKKADDEEEFGDDEPPASSRKQAPGEDDENLKQSTRQEAAPDAEEDAF